MRYKGLDLNLLTAFQVLMTERSVTAAARRLNLSQPATSSALSRLRDYFEDELLIVSGRTMLPTPKAETLMPLVHALLGDAERLVAASTRFDPGRTARQFRIAGSDYILTVLLAPMIARLEAEAPNIGFKLVPVTAASLSDLERGDVDLLLMPEQFRSPAHPSVPIFEEPHVVVGWSGNPVFDRPLTLDAFLAQKHVVVELGPTRALPFAEEHVRGLGLERRIDVVAPSFAAVPCLLPDTTRLAIMHRRLAETFAAWLPLTIAPLPFELPAMREVAQYHRTRDKDEGLHWLIGEMKRSADGIDDA
jgi:LysR family nod box-dependent transcriptional activator